MPRRSAPRPRGSLRYTKPPLSLDDLVDRLAGRGLQIPDRDRAIRYLRHIGYYRLSPYTIPFQRDRTEHIFREGIQFDDVLDLYVFDRALRLLVMDALERVEVAVRAALTDHMSMISGDPHWYMDPAHFGDQRGHAKLLKDIRETAEHRLSGKPELDASRFEPEDGGLDDDDEALVHRSALEHYLLTYGSPELPPSWLVVETLTIGQLRHMYRNLRRQPDKTAIARNLGLTAPVLDSWLQTYVRVRNICAHHGRLWNVGLGVYPAIPKSRNISWLQTSHPVPDRSTKRLYPVLVSLQSVLDSISPRSSWAQRLYDLVSSRPSMNRAGMGIPDDWAEAEFWARHLR